MQPSSNFFAFLSNEEGDVLHPYKDATGKPTIGYGSTYYENGTIVKMTDPNISEERARELLNNTLKYYIEHLNELVPYANQNQFDALLDFEYNLGWGNLEASTLLKVVRAGASNDIVKQAFMMWDEIKENGVLKVNEWQVQRREAEATLYAKPV